ncbi:DUF4261 domain-containing protein [Rhizobium leguminosarum]|uniref:DUF4261 domain-containing protein n=1 Tax=Rhizobium leguminosarum TaxID=384 RepID=UPI001C94887C|nr:DUF4261 domain-containing protein [Rhizobium leguminosarum]MBY5665359.1 DUF4261 domain-containing protein [Rhizobium leguminosarum]MBY5678532.1 DUF4261 domain-containing protein [Rhizobium leguminosarum]
MIAIVFLKDGDSSCLSPISLALQQSWPDPTIDISENDENRPLFVFHDSTLGGSVMFMDAPAPLGETDPEIRNAWFWPTAWEEVSRHRSHIIVTIFGGNGAKQKALGLQRMLQLILTSIPSTIGVGYPSSGTLLPTPMALSALEKNNDVAAPLFVSCFFAKEEASRFPVPSIFCSTEGLGNFGLKEIEARGYPGTIQSLHEFMFAFATYLIEYRPNVADGDTVGSDQQKILVKIEKSLIRESHVYSLYFQK